MTKPKLFVVSLFLGLIAAPAGAQDPAGFIYWNDSDLKVRQAKPAKDYKNYLLALVHREESSVGEAHGNAADTYIVQTGEATLVVGGQIPNAKTSASGEVRGDDIRDGVRKKLVPGVIAHIPAKMNHQVVVEPGKQVTYVIIKINTN